MQKIIFFDIDGTIWDNRMNIPESTVWTIKKLKEKGYKTFICSGRGRANIRSPKLLSLGFDGIIAACGNHIEMDGKVLSKETYKYDQENAKKDEKFLKKLRGEE